VNLPTFLSIGIEAFHNVSQLQTSDVGWWCRWCSVCWRLVKGLGSSQPTWALRLSVVGCYDPIFWNVTW